MGLFSGSLTYSRFFVEGDLPEGFHQKALRGIRARVMRPLEAEDEDLERSGWCRVGEPFELELEHNDVFYNEFVNLGFRTDRWVVPTPLLKAKLREAERAYLLKKGRERMTRKEKGELKLLIARKLRKQLSPATRTVDVSFSLNEGIVRFMSASPKAGALMCELFHKTFGLKLIPESPYTLAMRLGVSKTEQVAWDEAEVTLFTEEDA
jgi:DNA recombination-dependent growth factor C